MTERQRRFSELYAANPNATEAAKSAGYSTRTAYSIGQRLLKNAEIAAYIRELQEQTASSRIMSINRARALLSDIASSEDVAVTARLRAVDLLLKSAGAMLVQTASQRGEAAIQAGAEHEGEKEDYTLICLPWDGREDGMVNAVMLPDGNIVPIAGHENDDFLVFMKPDRMNGAQREQM